MEKEIISSSSSSVKTFNINIGILGHIDSGKTTLGILEFLLI